MLTFRDSFVNEPRLVDDLLQKPIVDRTNCISSFIYSQLNQEMAKKGFLKYKIVFVVRMLYGPRL
jgi:hypothetical protein